MSEQPIDSSIQKAKIHKEAGNLHLSEALGLINDQPRQAEAFTKALREYYSGYLYLRSVDVSETKREGFDDLVNGFLEEKQKKTEDQTSDIKGLKVQIWNNMSLIFMRQKKFKKALDLAEDILGFDPKNEKALLKVITASIELSEFEKADQQISKLEQLSLIDPKEIEVFKAKIESKRSSQSQNLKERLKNYF